MDGPPILPPVPYSDVFFGMTNSFAPSGYPADMNDHGRNAGPSSDGVAHVGDFVVGEFVTPPPAIPPPPAFAEPVPHRDQDPARGPSDAQPPTPPPPGVLSSPAHHRPRSGSRSRSRSRSSERTASESEESEEEEPDHPRHHWHTINEDKSEPCADEMEYIKSRAERSALDHKYWEKKAFFDLDDPELAPLGSGRIDWLVERFNGTKEAPNSESIMRSPVVSIGGYEWRIKFFPHGDDTHFLSVYVENVTMQSADFAEFEDFQQPPFPTLAGAESPRVKKRRSVAAQVAVVMYNPAEPRTHRQEMDAHQFNKSNADYGWRYFSPRHDFHYRQHGERQAILRDDKLAFSAYFRVVHDPTGCLWQHGVEDAYDNSIATTSLRPFACQLPHIAATVPLLHFAPFRQLVMKHEGSTKMIHSLQTFLYHKMFLRECSPHYGQQVEGEPADAIAYMRRATRLLQKECDPTTITELLGSFDSERGAAIGGNRLKTAACKSVQAAIDQHPTPIATPILLSLELQRHEFNREDRKWVKLTNKVEMNSSIVVSGFKYSLFSFITHCGDLQSNKHNFYVNPGGPGELWYAYSHRRVTAMTNKQAVLDHCGSDDGGKRKRCKRRDSPFSGIHDPSRDEVAYVVLYIRDDMASAAYVRPRQESWHELPETVKEGKAFSDPLEARPGAEKEEEEESSARPLNGEQTSHERERQSILEGIEAGSATPDWPLMDGEDVIMSDADDDEDVCQAVEVVASAFPVGTAAPPSSTTHAHVTTIDTLGRDYYQGQMLGSQYHGQGHLITLGGDEYVGAFRSNQQTGRGKMTYASTGNVYEGEWQAGRHHGRGKLTEASTGNVFEGGWQDGKKHGAFTLHGKVTEEDQSCCTICYVNAMTTAFYDCGHVVACRECAAKVDNCPVCRKRVLSRLELFGVKMRLE